MSKTKGLTHVRRFHAVVKKYPGWKDAAGWARACDNDPDYQWPMSDREMIWEGKKAHSRRMARALKNLPVEEDEPNPEMVSLRLRNEQGRWFLAYKQRHLFDLEDSVHVYLDRRRMGDRYYELAEEFREEAEEKHGRRAFQRQLGLFEREDDA